VIPVETTFSSLQNINMCEAKNFYIWLLQVLALLGILALCLWLILRPKAPNYTIVDVTIPQSSLANSEGQNGTIFYDLEIENPNKDSSVYYDDILFTFYHGQDTVGQKTIPSFHQGTHKTRQVIDILNANPRVWKSFVNAISNATAELRVGLLTKVRYKTWGQKSKHHKLDLEGKLPIGKDGKISGKKKKIKLRHHATKKWRRYKV
jgi:hypothetical protein